MTAIAYNGKILSIDLGLQSFQEILVDPKSVGTHFLGSGYAVHYFLKYLSASVKCDPLAPGANILLLAGLLTGTPVPTACKMSVCGRSPLTGIWNESTVGGHFPTALKGTGFDGILIGGRASSPVYIVVGHGGALEFRDASHLWGRDTFETDEMVREETDPKARVICIGPAGEKCVPIASLIAEGRSARSAGRGGMGAVFGSKNLKAIAVVSGRRMQVFDMKTLVEDVRAKNGEIRGKSAALHEFGTAGGMANFELHGSLPVKNWREGTFEPHIESISGQAISKLTFKSHYYCFSCPIGCGKIMDFIHPKYGRINSHSPEYEGAGGFSALILNRDPYLVCAASEYCDRMGMDTISSSAAVAFAMECYENGILTAADLGGIPISWGSEDAVMAILAQIAHKTGLGAVLGRGVKAASAEIGRNSSEFAIHVKGLEFPMHDPRAFFSMAANYATAARGACHLESLAYTLGFGRRYEGIGVPDEAPADSASAAMLAIRTQNFFGLFNPLGLCKFVARGGVSVAELSRWLKMAAGIDASCDQMLLSGERIFNEKRLFNTRLGISRKDDILPPRLFTKKRGAGRAADRLPDMGLILSEYYTLRGWSETGIPTRRKLDELGIDF